MVFERLDGLTEECYVGSSVKICRFVGFLFLYFVMTSATPGLGESRAEAQVVVSQPVVVVGVSGGVRYGRGYIPYWQPYHYPGAYPFRSYGYSYWQGPSRASVAAIAFSPSTGNTGWSFNHFQQNSAEQSAINFCDAEDCEAVVWVQDGCAAIATTPELASVSWAYERTKLVAQLQARASCQEAGGEQCSVEAWVCSN